MTRLEELYAKRQTFLEYGMDVPEKLSKDTLKNLLDGKLKR